MATATTEMDPHLAWEREAAALWGHTLPDEDADDARHQNWCDLIDRIADTPASTLAGIAAQVRLAIFADTQGSTLSEAEVRGLKNAVAALERMAGGKVDLDALAEWLKAVSRKNRELVLEIDARLSKPV